MAKDLVIGVDLGGTKISAALVASQDMSILDRAYMLTPSTEGPSSVVEAIFSAVEALLRSDKIEPSRLAAIAISSAGPSDPRTGVVFASPRIGGWHNVPLQNLVQERFDIPTIVHNDANAAAWGEFTLGAGRGTQNMVYVTVSTGIGGGLIIDGRLYTGASGTAGEIGHTSVCANGILCECGSHGCLEMYSSGTAIARRAQEALDKGTETRIAHLTEELGEGLTGRVVALAAQEGDLVALDIIVEAGNYLGVGLANLVNLLNPDMIVIGGGMAQVGDLLLGPAREEMGRRAFEMPAMWVKIVPAALGVDAPLLGVVALAFEEGS